MCNHNNNKSQPKNRKKNTTVSCDVSICALKIVYETQTKYTQSFYYLTIQRRTQRNQKNNIGKWVKEKITEKKLHTTSDFFLLKYIQFISCAYDEQIDFLFR